MKKIAILGGGISGVSAGRLLTDLGHDVTVYEKEAHVGGLTRTRTTKGFVYDMHGGHIFNSKHEEVRNWVFGIMPKEKFEFSVRNAQVLLGDRKVPYPFELSLCNLEPEMAVKCVLDFLEAKQGEKPENFRDWLTWNFGKGIADIYMIPYNEKIWSYPLEEMEISWVDGKMPIPEREDIIRSAIVRDGGERKMPHSTYYYPTHGGIQALIDSIGTGVKVLTETPLARLEKLEKGWCINGRESYDEVISTIPLPNLAKAMPGMPSEVGHSINSLKYNGITTRLYEAQPTDLSWLYIPDKNYLSHRVVYQGSLSSGCSPEGKSSGAVEIIGNHLEYSIAKGAPGLVPESLELGDFIDQEFTEFAYVIYDKNYQKNMARVREYFDHSTVHLLGRFAEWQYFNMDICMKRAMEVAEKITSGK